MYSYTYIRIMILACQRVVQKIDVFGKVVIFTGQYCK